MRIADAIFTRPEGMDGLEHVSVRTLIEGGTVFSIKDFVPRERKVWVDGRDTGEQETVADMSIIVGKDLYHVFINTRNLMSKLTKMSAYAEKHGWGFTCMFVKKGEMYDIVDA